MGILDRFGSNQPDRYSTNSSDGQTFSGYDSDDGKTAWYDKNGQLDSVTNTPDDDE